MSIQNKTRIVKNVTACVRMLVYREILYIEGSDIMKNQYKKIFIINESQKLVWEFLTKPEFTKQYMYNSIIVSSWGKDASFSWRGTYMGEKVETEGILLEYNPYSYFKFSELKNGVLDEIVSYKLEALAENQIKVTLIADYYGNNFSEYVDGWNAIVIKDFLKLSSITILGLANE